MVQTLWGRARKRAYREICSNHFVSFPKSGRTWIRRALEAYWTRPGGEGPPDLNLTEWTPFLRIGRWRRVPGLVFTHSEYLYDHVAVLDAAIRQAGRRRVILQARDPRSVVRTYYFQRIHRSRDAFAMSTDFSTFLRDPRYGIRRVIEDLNRWHRQRDRFRGYLLLRHEDNIADMAAQLGRLLSFIGVDANTAALAAAAGWVPDTTREIESVNAEPARDAGASPEDEMFMEREMQHLEPGFGYLAQQPDRGASARSE